MARQKIDGVIQAVHYNADGQVAWVRAFLRRGPTFSDYIMLDRQTLIDHLKKGSHFFAGRRTPYLASTFEVTEALRVLDKNGRELLVTGDGDADRDHLVGVPLI